MATKTKEKAKVQESPVGIPKDTNVKPVVATNVISAREAELDDRLAKLDAMETLLQEKLDKLEAIESIEAATPTKAEPEALYNPETPLPEEVQLWRFATGKPFTRVVKPSMIIADQVVQGQAIRTSTIPALRIEFNKDTLTYQTTDPVEAAEIMKDKMFRSKRSPAGKYWLVEGFPRSIGIPMADDPIHGPQPMTDNRSRVISGARGTSRRV